MRPTFGEFFDAVRAEAPEQVREVYEFYFPDRRIDPVPEFMRFLRFPPIEKIFLRLYEDLFGKGSALIETLRGTLLSDKWEPADWCSRLEVIEQHFLTGQVVEENTRSMQAMKLAYQWKDQDLRLWADALARSVLAILHRHPEWLAQKRRRSRPASEKEKAIISACQQELRGFDYCRHLDAHKVEPNQAWAPWPRSYEKAYKGDGWKKPIQDEKSRVFANFKKGYIRL